MRVICLDMLLPSPSKRGPMKEQWDGRRDFFAVEPGTTGPLLKYFVA